MTNFNAGDKVRVADNATTVRGGYVDPAFFGQVVVFKEIDYDGDYLVRAADGDFQFIAPEFLTLVEEEVVAPLQQEIKVGQKYELSSEGMKQGYEAEIISVSEDLVHYKPGLFYSIGNWEATSFLDNWKLVEDVTEAEEDAVNHPSHYNHGKYEVIEVIEDWGLDKEYFLGNVIKYVARHKHKGTELEDLKKARFYLERKIAQLEK